MNLMIVEDEPRLRQALAYNILWESHGIDMIGTAANGLDALKLMERKKPDLMLIDVQMPGMDGLTLLRELKERGLLKKLMKIIILSGHDNFEFAQTALKHGVSRYLLKPAGEEEILEAVLEARRQLQHELEQWRHQAALEKQWLSNLPHLQNLFFLQWAGGKVGHGEILSKCMDLQIPLRQEDRIAVAVMELDPSPEQGEKAEIQKFTLQILAKELLPPPTWWIATDSDMNLMMVFVVGPETEVSEAMLRMNADLSQLLSRIKEVLHRTASAGISAGAGPLEHLVSLYRQASHALQERVVYGHDLIIPYRETAREYARPFAIQPNLEKELEIAMETADEAKAMEALQGIWDEQVTKMETSDEFHESVFFVHGLFTRMIQKRGWTIKQVLGDDARYIQNMSLLSTQTQTWAHMTRIVNRIVVYVKEQRKANSHQVVKEILRLLNEEMDQELTLHTVADRMYINSSYLSRLFKQEMGVAFSDYVLERKMERAKSLLQEGHKVYDAARSVGYRDVSYFTKVFRKYWGVNPGECKG
ncbi:AraC family transcriptional regulator [Paenibacillus sp. J53TS2]|uniref:response regulator transcription factor n=1 Tax=Paenibacillus sp. J53TS2 TaxID=2807197 RepID=UPI001B229BFD|nr:response regulator [Paenibacillus sp. J53TS2]GIP46821.1 AraC family transcriptional regulator [Paenibacillus sp. J53TS2]